MASLALLTATAPCSFGATKKATAKPTATTASPYAAGKSCVPLGAQSPTGGLDCIRVGTVLQWQPRGSKLNPHHINDVIVYRTFGGDRWRVKLSGASVLTPAAIQAPSPSKYPIPSGSVPVRFAAEITYLGPKPVGDLPGSAGVLEAVDAKGAVVGLFGPADCANYGNLATSINVRALTMGVAQATGFCVVLPQAAIGPTLLVHLWWSGDPNGTWFNTTA